MSEGDKYGHYTVLRIVDQVRFTEHCNVGILLFDHEGRNAGCKADTNARAIRMGVLHEDWIEHLNIVDFENRMQRMQDMDQLKKTLSSMGHAMSMIQFRDPLPCLTRQGDLDRLFDSFVLGKKYERTSTGG